MNVVSAALSSYVFGFERTFVQKFRTFNVDEIDTLAQTPTSATTQKLNVISLTNQTQQEVPTDSKKINSFFHSECTKVKLGNKSCDMKEREREREKS